VTVALVTCSDMPKPDLDEPLLLAALDDLGVTHDVVAWDSGADWSAFDLVVLRTPWDYIDRVEEFVAWAQGVEAVTRLQNSAATVEWNTHKRYLFDLEAAAVPIVPTRMVARDAPFAFQRAALRRFEGEVVVKPAVGIGAFGVARLEAGTEEAFAHLEALCLLGDTLIQPMVPSVAHVGEVSLVHLGGGFSHAVRKIPAAGEFRIHDHHGGRVVVHEPTEPELAVAEDALAAVANETGAVPLYARIDLVDLAGPVVTEVEITEPELFLRLAPGSAERFAEAIAEAVPSPR